MTNRKLRIIFYSVYFISMILLTRLVCVIDGKLKAGIIVNDIKSIEGIVETEAPQ